MSRTLVERIADAVLYEGYILYPYRPSLKNHQRWSFGGLLPPAYVEAHPGSDASSNQTECLLQGSADTILEVSVRFLHLIDRTVGEFDPPLETWTDELSPHQPTDSLRVDDEIHHSWQEAQERMVKLPLLRLGEATLHSESIEQQGECWREPLCRRDGLIAGLLIRRQEWLRGSLELAATVVADGLFKVTLRVANLTPLDDAAFAHRDDALLRSFVSTHSILTVKGGEFVSLLDPPECWCEAAASCRNIGTWPVLAGEEGQRDTMLSSPIILYDFPQIAPESPGDLFDGLEIDEILTLRILTMTDEEKHEAAAVDGRVRALMQRTESLARDQMLGLHGTMRGLRSL